ncbi:MoaF C-terminal domain-containing protein [Entomomonas asaccharolytica]|uniref:MoaF N-terminal domain-containing protein n=1 Tax=Entomomonas asaccharolytica TaxID=2785331 RepID=A0A974RXS2_9GAMM|nr:MoaF C-terminal domain-containing protein [Entomomonas asaccharolytica]QQP85174.1 MoaF N-terminal domain-containing protein [Entomomonas asaccharolytica]
MYQIKTHDYSVSGRPKEFILPDVTELEGLFFILYPTHGDSIEYNLKKQQIIWYDPDTNTQQKADYKATSVRDGIYFIDYIFQEQSISIILDLINQTFTEVVGYLSNIPTAKAFKQFKPNIATIDLSIIQGSLDKPYEKQDLHNQTDELIGARFLYFSGFERVYEHIYLNQNHYTWHCLVGETAGLADTNPCHYYKIADKLYLLIWSRKRLPYMGLMLIDTNFLRADGKAYGYNQINTTDSMFNIHYSPYFSMINKPNIPYSIFLENMKNRLS